MSEGPGDEQRPGNGHRGEERPQLIAQAWRMRTRDSYTLRQIAQELDISVPTAKEYVRIGQQAEGHTHLIDIMERRENSIAALDFWKGEIATRYRTRVLSLEKAFPLWLAADNAQALRGGFNAPAKVHVTDGEPPVPVEVLQAVRETQRQVYEEQQEIERRWSGDDDD